jgi:hypothetical protein
MLSSSRSPSCTDSTGHCTDDTRRAGIIWRLGPRVGPRSTSALVAWVTELAEAGRINQQIDADQLFTRSTAPCTERASCTNATPHRIDCTRCAGTIWWDVPRTVPRERRRQLMVAIICSDQTRCSDLTTSRQDSRTSYCTAESDGIWIKAAPAAPLARRQRRPQPWRPARRTPGHAQSSSDQHGSLGAH